jgi:hypothetical protein
MMRFFAILTFLILLNGCVSPKISTSPPKTSKSNDSFQSMLSPCKGTDITLWDLCFGEMKYPNGTKYIGEWKSGEWTGRGTVVYPDGPTYNSQRRDAPEKQKNLSSQITFIFEDRTIFRAQKNNGFDLSNDTVNGTYFFPSGVKAIGIFKFPTKSGTANIVFFDGRIYEGMIKNGTISGTGKLIFPDKTTYSGLFANNEFNGQGTLVRPDGTKYVGTFVAGKYSGSGQEIFADGRTFSGEFLNGQYHGQGTYTFPDGRKYTGNWINDKPDGHGIQTDNSKIQRAGRWADGIFIGTARTASPPRTPNARVSTLEERARQGDAQAQYEYGMTFIDGIGDEVKPRIAIEWLMRSAAQGHTSAKRQIASMYDLGIQMMRMPSPIQVRE